jgi:hypothetical protein
LSALSCCPGFLAHSELDPWEVNTERSDFEEQVPARQKARKHGHSPCRKSPAALDFSSNLHRCSTTTRGAACCRRKILTPATGFTGLFGVEFERLKTVSRTRWPILKIKMADASDS